MKLFLTSQDLGAFGERLAQLVGEKRKALVISNARDYYQDEERIAGSVEKTLVNLRNLGMETERLDLRQYFGKTDELKQFLAEYQPGLIFSIGGVVYCLATALRESGMAEIIRAGVQNGDFVYGGYSAGAMVTAKDLMFYQVEEKFSPQRAAEVYGVEPCTDGLGLIKGYIAPHMDRADHIETMEKRLAQIERAGQTAILLNDADVYVVDGAKAEVLRKG